MAVDFIQKGAGNSASTTLASGVTDSDTSFPLTSDTAFLAGGGMVIVDEGEATEELAYYTGKSGGALTVPLANRGLEGGSAQAHATGATVKGILSADMWNNAMEALLNLVVVTSGAVDGTKVMAITSGDGQLATGGNIQVNSADPYRTIVLPAGSMSPTTTAGCASVATVEAGTNDVDYKVLDFDTASDESAFFLLSMPDSWDGGTVTFIPYWTAASGTGTVCFSLAGRAFANDDAIDQAYGTPQTSTDTLITAGDVHIGPASSAITLAGSPAGGQLVQFKITRDVSEDTLGVDARLIAVKIEYKVAQYSD